MAIDVLNHLILESIPNEIVNINGFVIPSLMYCDDTVICTKNPSAIITALSTLKHFAEFSGLKVNRFKSVIIDNSNSPVDFGIPKVQSQTARFLKHLPDKYFEIQKVISKAIFWAQCESITPAEWQKVNNMVYQFRFSKKGKESFPPMNLFKASVRAEASSASLFFYDQRTSVLNPLCLNMSTY
eukprot:TRINITY_DN806_c0_g1_i20.p1 TRINITY_DN806_c0_g1~~TRINITY_DN806_c0_g1_i20.p1  ORF type:complete len:184 (-),score=7.14 TRINITY_DN806_c0_g1_i20:279-830(-)